jgi:hypothetical protein
VARVALLVPRWLSFLPCKAVNPTPGGSGFLFVRQRGVDDGGRTL